MDSRPEVEPALVPTAVIRHRPPPEPAADTERPAVHTERRAIHAERIALVDLLDRVLAAILAHGLPP